MGEVIRATFPHVTQGESVSVWNGEGFGVDRLTVTFPVRRVQADAFGQKMTRRRGGEDQVSYGEHVTLVRDAGTPERAGKPLAGVYVGATEIEGVSFLRLDANPARLLDPAGHSLLPTDKIEHAAMLMWAVGENFADPMCAPEDCNVTRVDVARDFPLEVAPAEFYVRGLQNIRRPYARRVGVWSSAQHGNAQTLHVGSGAGMVRLYDQEAAYGVTNGLRWECEARKGWLYGDGKVRLRDLSGARLEALARDRWEWSRMGTEVKAAVNVVEAIEAKVCRCRERGLGECADKDAHMTRVVADRLLGKLVREAYGVGGTSRTSAWRYEKLSRVLGQVPVADLFAQGMTVDYTGRLDFESGREVAA